MVTGLRKYGKPWKGKLLVEKNSSQQEAPEERNITQATKRFSGASSRLGYVVCDFCDEEMGVMLVINTLDYIFSAFLQQKNCSDVY